MQTFGFMPRLKLFRLPNPYAPQWDDKLTRAPLSSNSLNQTRNETNLFEQYEQLYGQKPIYDGPNISPKIPIDQVNYQKN